MSWSCDLLDPATARRIGSRGGIVRHRRLCRRQRAGQVSLGRPDAAAAKPWTLGEVLSGGIGGFVHWFVPGGPCYGCVASHLQRTVSGGQSHGRPTTRSPAAPVPETTIPASMASIHAIASLHALVTLELLADPARTTTPASRACCSRCSGCRTCSRRRSGRTVSVSALGGLLDLPGRPSAVSPSEELDVALDQALARLGNDMNSGRCYRIGPQPQALHYSYEKAGLTLHDQPIPWNAEAVLVEASLRLPAPRRRKADFLLRLADGDPVAAEHLRREEGADRYRLFFRLPPPAFATAVTLCWNDHPSASSPCPF